MLFWPATSAMARPRPHAHPERNQPFAEQPCPFYSGSLAHSLVPASLLCGAAIPGCSRLSAGAWGNVNTCKSRLKGGFSQECLPHLGEDQIYNNQRQRHHYRPKNRTLI